MLRLLGMEQKAPCLSWRNRHKLSRWCIGLLFQASISSVRGTVPVSSSYDPSEAGEGGSSGSRKGLRSTSSILATIFNTLLVGLVLLAISPWVWADKAFADASGASIDESSIGIYYYVD